jgi:hypothetical protein
VAVIAGIEVGVVYMPFALVRDGLLLLDLMAALARAHRRPAGSMKRASSIQPAKKNDRYT